MRMGCRSMLPGMYTILAMHIIRHAIMEVMINMIMSVVMWKITHPSWLLGEKFESCRH
jgi:hypothetical protein